MGSDFQGLQRFCRAINVSPSLADEGIRGWAGVSATLHGEACYRAARAKGISHGDLCVAVQRAGRDAMVDDDRNPDDGEGKGDETDRKAAPKDSKRKKSKKGKKSKMLVTAPVRKEKAMSLSKLRREARYEMAAIEARDERRAHRERDAHPETQKALRLSGFESSESLHDALHVARAEAQEKHPKQPGRTGRTSFEKAVTGGMSLAEAKAFVERARKAAKVV
jgi:hypothetical protein